MREWPPRSTVTEAVLSQPLRFAVTEYSPPWSIIRLEPVVPPVQVRVAVLGVQEAVKVWLTPLQMAVMLEVMLTVGVWFTFS